MSFYSLDWNADTALYLGFCLFSYSTSMLWVSISTRASSSCACWMLIVWRTFSTKFDWFFGLVQSCYAVVSVGHAFL